MPDKRQTNAVNADEAFPDDEITLIDLFLILWRWKYLIIGVAVVCALVAGFVSYQKPTLYRISTVIEIPPLELLAEMQEKRDDINFPQKIKAYIDQGLYDKSIIDNLKKIQNITISTIPRIDVQLIRDSKLIEFSFNLMDPKLGSSILTSLKSVLLEKYMGKIKILQKKFNQKKKTELRLLENKIRLDKTKMDLLSKRLNELSSAIKLVNQKSELLLIRNNPELKKNESNDLLTQLLFHHMINQNADLLNTYKNKRTQYSLQFEEMRSNINNLESQVQFHRKEIKEFDDDININYKLKIKKLSDNNIQPVKSNIKRNAMLAAIASLPILALISLFLDYIIKYKKNQYLEKSG